MWAWHPGTMGGPAIADLLFGRAVPSGKLTVTFPRTVGQVPIYYAHLNTGRPAAADELGIPMGNPAEPKGYTSKYIDVDFTPEYPFGYGLSYTEFAYSNLRLSAPAMGTGGTLTASADITNRGGREAAEVVQFYVHRGNGQRGATGAPSQGLSPHRAQARRNRESRPSPSPPRTWRFTTSRCNS